MDGLWDCFYDCHMGTTAENLAAHYGIDRQEQDRFAARSQLNYRRAHDSQVFVPEITPVEVPQRKGPAIVFEVDEHPRADADMARLSKLKPAFADDGTVTAGNASGINDAAAAVLVMSEAAARAPIWFPWPMSEEPRSPALIPW